MTNKRICHITTVHPLHDARIFHKQCLSLAGAGYETILAVRNQRDEIIDGVKICALPKPQNRWARVRKLQWRVLKIVLKENPAICHFHDPELIPIAVLMKLMGKKVIYDVHEDYPQSFLGNNRQWIPHWCKRMVSRGVFVMERIGASIFDGIIAATPAIGNNFPPSKTVVVNNYPVAREFQTDFSMPNVNGEPVIVYIGAISAIRGVINVVRSVEVLNEQYKCRLAMAGLFESNDIEKNLRQLSGWRHVDFVGWLSQDQVAALLRRARVGVVLFHPAPNHAKAQPHKLFEYMSAGIPVVASDFPLWRDIVKGNQCGLLVDPLDVQAIARAIAWLIEHPNEASEMGRRGQVAVKKKYNWDTEVKKLLKCYERIL